MMSKDPKDSRDGFSGFGRRSGEGPDNRPPSCDSGPTSVPRDVSYPTPTSNLDVGPYRCVYVHSTRAMSYLDPYSSLPPSNIRPFTRWSLTPTERGRGGVKSRS